MDVFSISGGQSFAEALVFAFLIGGPGTVLLYGGYRLPQTDLHPDGYPHIAGWSLGDQETAAGPETVQTRPRLPGVRPPEREAMRGINGLFHVLFPYIPSMGIRA